jgi:hypothetical protein
LTTSYEPLSADELKEFSRKRESQALANPDYTNRVNARRKKLGVPPLGPNGMAACQTSWKVAYAEAELRFPNE